jgi:SAM-dependent methyltransferase
MIETSLRQPLSPQEVPVAAMVRHCAKLLGERLAGRAPLSGLVVGCGNGDEVVYLRHAFRSPRIFGLDMETCFAQAARAERCVLRADAQRLPFPSEAFDFAAAFHSLEHVGNTGQALDEIRCVLRPGGWFYMGVPNKSRAVGYLGSGKATTWQKITWNLTDWKARLRGKFENEMGAHAGFARAELSKLLTDRFANVQLVTDEFIRFKYAGWLPAPVLNLLLAQSVVNYTAPAHYALCQRPEA